MALYCAKYFSDKDGGLSLGPGGLVLCPKEADGVTSEVVGKPPTLFFQAALLDLGVEARNAAMIGDDAAQDISGIVLAGI